MFKILCIIRDYSYRFEENIGRVPCLPPDSCCSLTFYLLENCEKSMHCPFGCMGCLGPSFTLVSFHWFFSCLLTFAFPVFCPRFQLGWLPNQVAIINIVSFSFQETCIQIITSGGKKVIMYQEYTFSLQGPKSGRMNYCYCSKRLKGCPARLTLNPSGAIIKASTEHNHEKPVYKRIGDQYIKISN